MHVVSMFQHYITMIHELNSCSLYMDEKALQFKTGTSILNTIQQSYKNT